MKNIMANLVYALHLVLLTIGLAGWIHSDHNWMIGYACFLALILVQWKITSDRCVLTIWEHKLRHGVTTTDKTPENTFVGRICHSLFGFYPTYEQVNRVSYGVISALLVITVSRILVSTVAH